MKKSLNENIKALRQQRGLSQVELSNKLLVTKQCVSNWENDNVLPSIEMLERIADFFGVSTDYLLGRVDEDAVRVDGLTEMEISHIRLLIDDLKNKNRAK